MGNPESIDGRKEQNNYKMPVRLVGAITLAAIGLGAMGFAAKKIIDDGNKQAEERLENIQIYNEQVAEYLDPHFPGLSSLHLSLGSDGNKGNFDFKSTPQGDEEKRECTGSYRVENHLYKSPEATPVGSVLCEIVIPLNE